MRSGLLFFFCFFLKGILVFAQQDNLEQALRLIQQGSYDQATPYLLRSAITDQDQQAAFLLSQAYRSGTGTAASDSLADEWMLRSAELGYPPAMFSAAEILLDPHSSFSDSLKGISILRKGATQQQADCQSLLAGIYLSKKSLKSMQDSAFLLLNTLASNQSLSDSRDLLYRQNALETLFDLHSDPQNPKFNEAEALACFLLWNENKSLCSDAITQLYSNKAKTLMAKMKKTQSEKALALAEKRSGKKMKWPPDLMPSRTNQP
jgi:hypothetical protein